MKFQKINREQIVIIILIILYSVGLFGILSPTWKDTILPLSSINLTLSFLAILLTIEAPRGKLIKFLCIAFLIGWISEWVGVNTAYLFGVYHYDVNLGTKIFGVPIVIGLNWATLSVGASYWASRLSKQRFIRIIIGALIMVLFDILMEPVAIRNEYWTWENNYIPIFNYVSWLLVSLLLQGIYFYWIKESMNKVVGVLFILMSLFFIILNLF